MKHPTPPFFTVSVASSLVGVSPQTLRKWERYGLIAPVREGRARRRLYAWPDIERAQQIRYLVVRKRVALRHVKMQLRLAAVRKVPLVPTDGDRHRGAPLFPRLALAIPR
jgi:DNA-binding transcriptional MerR regulator